MEVLHVRAASISNAPVAAAIIYLMSVFANTAQAQVPTINVRETCRAAASVTLGGGQNDFENCVNSENTAREKMIRDWSTL
jgi:hypothetical protein